MEFWRDELEALERLGHPPENLPLASPTEAKALRDGWKKNHALAVKPLDRYRDIYRGQLEKIRQEYSRRQHRRGMELLDIESAAALDPNYFLALCTGRSGRCGMLVPGNVARASLGAVASGVEKPASVNDGISNMASGQLGIPIRVELGGLLRLTRIRFELNSVDAAHYFRYHARVCPDGVHWESVCDRSQDGRWRHWQVIDFPPRAVRFIEVVGTFNSTNRNSFAIRELEAFCVAQDD